MSATLAAAFLLSACGATVYQEMLDTKCGISQKTADDFQEKYRDATLEEGATIVSGVIERDDPMYEMIANYINNPDVKRDPVIEEQITQHMMKNLRVHEKPQTSEKIVKQIDEAAKAIVHDVSMYNRGLPNPPNYVLGWAVTMNDIMSNQRKKHYNWFERTMTFNW